MSETRDAAQAELSEINEQFTLKGARIHAPDLSGFDRTYANWMVTHNGRRFRLIAHLNRRRKALHEWVEKWGQRLKAAGYSVVTHEDWPSIPEFTIVQNVAVEEDGAQIEDQDEKNFFDPKRQRSKRLGKLPEGCD